ncbi:MAG: biopolymer transporter ExbD [Verrucomicrobia bacterium]|nr:biopolymer transporter ExbD [Verrucomicrobiota bacterium]
MRFFVRKRKQTPGVIIIALIDVLIVMLIFLMATTTFRQHPALKLALPQSSQARKEGASPEAALVVSVDLVGDLRLGSSPKPVTPDDLTTALQIEKLKNPEVQLAIRADEGAPFGRIVRVMDAAKVAGIQTVSAFTRKAGQP